MLHWRHNLLSSSVKQSFDVRWCWHLLSLLALSEMVRPLTIGNRDPKDYLDVIVDVTCSTQVSRLVPTASRHQNWGKCCSARHELPPCRKTLCLAQLRCAHPWLMWGPFPSQGFTTNPNADWGEGHLTWYPGSKYHVDSLFLVSPSETSYARTRTLSWSSCHDLLIVPLHTLCVSYTFYAQYISLRFDTLFYFPRADSNCMWRRTSSDTRTVCAM